MLKGIKITSDKFYQRDYIIFSVQYFKLIRVCPRGVMVKAMDSEIVLKLCYYVHFRANTLGKSMKPFILPAMG